MKFIVQKLFIPFVFLITLNIGIVNSKSLEEVKLLPPDRLIELAETGNPDAQYWLAELIYYGAIENYGELFNYMVPFWERAMKQGHALATYKLHHYMDDDDPKSPEITYYLKKLAEAGEAKANYIMFWKTLDELRLKGGRGSNNLLDKIADRYLLRAYELGSRAAAESYAYSLSYGSISIQKDHSLAVKVLEEAYAMKPDEERDNYSLGTCSTLIRLADYYSGHFQDGGEFYLGEVNVESYFHTLSRGVKHSCNTLMFDYSEYILESGKEEDFIDAYLVAMTALEISKARFNITGDYMYELLGTLALRIKEPLIAKEHFSKMRLEERIEGLFSENLGAYGFKLCSALDVPKNECRAFIFN